jgi:hypothetical protein
LSARNAGLIAIAPSLVARNALPKASIAVVLVSDTALSTTSLPLKENAMHEKHGTFN